jgi:hypothetical protein
LASAKACLGASVFFGSSFFSTLTGSALAAILTGYALSAITGTTFEATAGATGALTFSTFFSSFGFFSSFF